MAWQYVGSTTGTGTGATYTISLSGTLTGGIASSPATNDLVVVFTAFGNTAASAPAVSGNNMGAYSSAITAQHSNDTWDTEFGVFYDVMGATPDTQLTITRVNNAAYGGATVVHVWRGVDTATPFIGAATPATGNNGNRVDPPSYDPAVAGALVIGGGAGTFATADTAGYTSWGSVLTNTVVAYGNGSTSDTGVIVGSATYAGAAIDPPIATGGNTNTSASWAAATVAFRVGLERVTNDYSDSYTVYQSVTKDFADAYGITAKVANNFADAYTVFNRINQSFADAYMVYLRIAQSYADAYTITGRLTRALADAYTLTGRIGQNLADAYTVTGRIGASYADAYAIAGIPTQYARPSSTIAAGAWLPSTPAAALWDMIDETVANDSDYIYVGQSSSMAEVGLNAVTDPGDGYGHAVRVRASGNSGQTLRVALMQGAVQIATWDQVLTGSPTTYTLSLSTAEVNSITNYADLRMRYTGL